MKGVVYLRIFFKFAFAVKSPLFVNHFFEQQNIRFRAARGRLKARVPLHVGSGLKDFVHILRREFWNVAPFILFHFQKALRHELAHHVAHGSPAEI